MVSWSFMQLAIQYRCVHQGLTMAVGGHMLASIKIALLPYVILELNQPVQVTDFMHQKAADVA